MREHKPLHFTTKRYIRLNSILYNVYLSTFPLYSIWFLQQYWRLVQITKFTSVLFPQPAFLRPNIVLTFSSQNFSILAHSRGQNTKFHSFIKLQVKYRHLFI